MDRYIIRNGERIYLNYNDEQMLKEQRWLIDAKNTIENQCENVDEIISLLTDKQLIALGEMVETDYMANQGDTEWRALKDFSDMDIIKLDESISLKKLA